MSKAVLVDTTKCMGCRACQVSCKQWNGLKAEETYLEGRKTGYQNPPTLSSKTFTMVTFKELEAPEAPGKMKWVFAKRQCMHCNEPACASACPVTALRKTPEGPVTYDDAKCMGCRYCVWACPFGIPTADWDSLAPRIRKCEMCFDRITGNLTPSELNEKPATGEFKKEFDESQKLPACVKTCAPGALKFGDRDALIAEGWSRIKASPSKYYSHIYGEKEVGGTSFLYLASVPFEKLGFRTDLGDTAIPHYSKIALEAVGPAVIGLGGLLAGIYLVNRRKEQIKNETNKGKKE